MPDRRGPQALAILAAAVALASCHGPGPRVREALPPENAVEATRELLQSLRPEADELLRSLPEEAVPDGMPLLRKNGALAYWDAESDANAESGAAWVVDAWGRQIVLIQSEDDPADWCLISAGPDGLWTSDVTLGAKPDASRQAFVDRAPHYYGAEDSIHRRVLGDDIVLHATGLFFKPYEFPPPKPGEVAAGLWKLLTAGPSASGVLAAHDLLDELGEMSRGEKELAAAFVRKEQAGLSFCEDTWSHECTRKDGLLPYLFLCHAKRFEKQQPPFWIQPEEEGWTLDWNLDALLEALGSEERKE